MPYKYTDTSGHGPIIRFFKMPSTAVLPPKRIILFVVVGFVLSLISLYAFGDDYAVGMGRNGVKVMNAKEFPISLSFRNVGCRISGLEKPILEGITGEIFQGRFTGILGRSGSGKSTLARALLGRTGYCAPSLGYVYTNGYQRSLDAISDRVGFVPQDDVLYPELTVEESLLFSANWRLPSGTSSRVRRTILNKTLSILGLQNVVSVFLINQCRNEGFNRSL